MGNSRSLLITSFFAVVCLLALGAGLKSPQTYKPSVVLRGAHSENPREEIVRIEDADKWKDYWLDTVGEHPGPDAYKLATIEVPEIDFANWLVIGISMGPVTNLQGYKFKESTIESEEVFVRLDLLSFQTGPVASQCSPYTALVLPRTDKTIRLQLAEYETLGGPFRGWQDMATLPAAEE